VINASFIVGFTEGEGCFLVCLRKSNRIDLRFFISQAIGNKPLLEKVHKFFKVGAVYQKSNREGRLPAYVFEIAKRDDVYNVAIPFFTKNKLHGYKAMSFKAFREIAMIVKGRQDVRKLTQKELKRVKELKFSMNKHYGSPDAEKPLVGWERAKISN
jgi:hypothetical protein